MNETANPTEEQRWRAWAKEGKERQRRNQRRLGIAVVSVLLLAGVGLILFTYSSGENAKVVQYSGQRRSTSISEPYSTFAMLEQQINGPTDCYDCYT